MTASIPNSRRLCSAGMDRHLEGYSPRRLTADGIMPERDGPGSSEFYGGWDFPARRRARATREGTPKRRSASRGLRDILKATAAAIPTSDSSQQGPGVSPVVAQGRTRSATAYIFSAAYLCTALRLSRYCQFWPQETLSTGICASIGIRHRRVGLFCFHRQPQTQPLYSCGDQMFFPS